MDRVTRCLHCGKRMVPAPSLTGRTELICVYCDKADQMAAIPEEAAEIRCSQQSNDTRAAAHHSVRKSRPV